MRNRLSNKIKESELRKGAMEGLFERFKYAALTLIALWMSIRFSGMCKQFLVLAVILGLKWVFTGRKQPIQIFMPEEGVNESK